MINDIINEFERKFNKFADTTDAFTSRFIRDEDSAVGTLCFNEFNVEFEYCIECGGTVEKSGLNIIFDFSKRLENPLRCMMYDIIGFVDENNFNCWFYCFIENAERMELCFDKLVRDFKKVFPKIRQYFSPIDNINKVIEAVRVNIKRTVGVDIIDEWKAEFEDDDEINLEDAYNYLFNLYFGFEQCAFASYAYRDFLEGDWKKALHKYKKKKNKLIYEEKIIEYINSHEPEVILTEEYECLKDGLRENSGASGFWPFFGACALLFVPFLVLCVGFYYLIGAIVYNSAVYATSLEWYNALFCLIPALICSVASGYFVRERIYRKFFRKKFIKMKDYEAIFDNEKTVKRIRVIFYLIYIIALIAVFLCANNGIAFTENGVRDKTGYFTIVGSYHSYSDVSSLYSVDDGKTTDYVLEFIDGSSVDISGYADNKQIEQYVIPLLEQNGVSLIMEKPTEISE